MAGSATSVTGSSNVQNVENLDRISNLPHHLLSHILSLLPTDESVATSILSKRWRFLWTTITAIDITFYKKRCPPTFIDFVMNRLLLHRNSPSIHKFSLGVIEFTEDSLIKKWVSALGERKVKHIKLTISNFVEKYCIEMPWRSLLDCKKLEVLILSGSGILFNIPKEVSICFPTLKVLHLEHLQCGEISAEEGSICCFPVLHTIYLWHLKYMKNDDSVNKLLCKCPVFEVVHIKNRSNGDNLSSIHISSLSLKRCELELQCSRAYCKVEIDAPALQYVTIIGLIDELILKQIPYSIVEAKILVTARNSLVDVENYTLTQYIPFFNHITAVDFVKYQPIIKVAFIGCGILNLPSFCNLTRLEVSLWCEDMSYLQCFLERSFNLQYLVIQKVSCGFAKSESGKCGYEESNPTTTGTKKSGWNEFFTVPECLISSLKGLEIDGVYGCPNEVAMIKYMLKNTKVLQKVIVQFHGVYGYPFEEKNADKRSELLEMISMFPRGSMVTEVEFK